MNITPACTQKGSCKVHHNFVVAIAERKAYVKKIAHKKELSSKERAILDRLTEAIRTERETLIQHGGNCKER